MWFWIECSDLIGSERLYIPHSLKHNQKTLYHPYQFFPSFVNDALPMMGSHTVRLLVPRFSFFSGWMWTSSLTKYRLLWLHLLLINMWLVLIVSPPSDHPHRLHEMTQVISTDALGKFTLEFFAVYTNVADLTFLPMLYTWTNASILSYVKMLLYAKDLISDIYGQHLNNSELQNLYKGKHWQKCQVCHFCGNYENLYSFIWFYEDCMMAPSI